MAAFTSFSEEALQRYLVMFGKGELQGFEPISGGIENSNYFVTLDEGNGPGDKYVLTIIEAFGFDEVPFFSKVMSHLFHYGLPVAAPQATLDGMTSTIFCGKPAFLFNKLPGDHPVDINASHCQLIGEFLASAHNALEDLSTTRDNPYDLDWMQSSLRDLSSKLDAGQHEQLAALIAEYEQINSLDLPRGLIHGDLFVDNALFTDTHELSGVIDFYHACEDLLIQDLAIAINDWCRAASGGIDAPLRQAMLEGYESLRKLSGAEQDALLPLQRASAGRFALTRYLSGEPPLKDPQEMLDLARTLG